MVTPLLIALAAYADDLVVDSKITEVIVYTDRARVTRQVTVDVPPGRTDLVFDGLPLGVLDNSLSAEGEGTAGAVLTGTDFRTTRGVEDRDAQIATLRTDRRKHEDAIRVAADTIARTRSDITFVSSLKPTAPGKLSEPLFLAGDAATQLGAVSRSIGADLVTLYKELRAAEIEVETHQREIDRIDRELYTLGQGSPDANKVAVGLDAKQSGKVTVRLSYVVTGAGWAPHWDARFRPSDGKVRLDLSGEVVQTTGESWDDVKLVLSTARASQSTAPPELQPFYLGESYATRGPALVADKATAIEFPAPSKEDVPSGGTRRRVFVATFETQAKLVHQVVARRVEAAYLTARLTNTQEFALLPGSLSSYMGTAYVGEGTLPLTAPQSEVDVSFGVDDRVRVKRTRLEQVASEAKPLQNRERQHYGWKTTVTNRTGKAITLKVLDQIPATREAAFTVESMTTPPAGTIPTDGVFSWTLDLGDGKSQDFVLEYDVTWPEGDRPVLLE